VFLGGSDCLPQGVWTSKGTLLLCLKETEMHEAVRSIQVNSKMCWYKGSKEAIQQYKHRITALVNEF